jgi:ABC-type branched-subunit amino acid transport system permease subunit
LGAALLTPLGFLLPAEKFRTSRGAVTGGAGIFWLAFSLMMTQTMWQGYYGYFYPAWMKWVILLVAAVIFPGLAFVFHWLACRLPGHPLGWFCLFVGLESMVEHSIAWMNGLPEKVPYLNGAPLAPVLTFAFFEYQIYWAIALWLAWLLVKLAEKRKGTDAG